MRIILILNLLLVITNSCNRESGIQRQTQHQIESHKTFIKGLSFDGVISDKVYCEKCNFNKYQIKVKLDKKLGGVELSNLSFQPYYRFSNDNEIVFSVVKELYVACSVGKRINKQAGSENLKIGSENYKLISKETYAWLP